MAAKVAECELGRAKRNGSPEVAEAEFKVSINTQVPLRVARVPWKKFITGEPRKPATKRLAGEW